MPGFRIILIKASKTKSAGYQILEVEEGVDMVDERSHQDEKGRKFDDQGSKEGEEIVFHKLLEHTQ